MKDLTAYFKSPPKTGSSNVETDSEKGNDLKKTDNKHSKQKLLKEKQVNTQDMEGSKVQEENINDSADDFEPTPVGDPIENSNNAGKTASQKENSKIKIKGKKSRKKGKKHKSKEPDPVVSDISDLMSTSLSMISPDKGLISTIKRKLQEKMEQYSLPPVEVKNNGNNNDVLVFQEDTSESIEITKETVHDIKTDEHFTPSKREGPILLSPPSSKQKNKVSPSKRSKVKRKSKLSLNSNESCSEKQDTSHQSSLTSFFHKVITSPKAENDNRAKENIQKITVEEKIQENKDIATCNEVPSYNADMINDKKTGNDKKAKNNRQDKSSKKDKKLENVSGKGNKDKKEKQFKNDLKKEARPSEENVTAKVQEINKEISLKVDLEEKARLKTPIKNNEIKAEQHNSTSKKTKENNQKSKQESKEKVKRRTSLKFSKEKGSTQTNKRKEQNESKSNEDNNIIHSKSKEEENKNDERKLEDNKVKSAEKPTAKNVFQFMMDSRNKSIGSNSPGKEAEPEVSPNTKEAKLKLSARKLKFESWANEKGGLKRKVEEEERDEIIQEKLEVRAKRLKKMLTQEGEGEESGPKEMERKKRKRIQKIKSDTESSTDDEKKEVIKTPHQISKKPKLAPDVDVSDVSPTTKFGKNSRAPSFSEDSQDGNTKPVKNFVKQVGLLNFFEFQKKSADLAKGDGASKDDDVLVVDDDEEEMEKKPRTNLIKVKMFSPKVLNRKKSKAGLKKKENEISQGKTTTEGELNQTEENEKISRLGLTVANGNDSAVETNRTDGETDHENTPKSNKKLKRIMKHKRIEELTPKSQKLIPKLRIKFPTDDDETYSIVSDGSNFGDLEELDEHIKNKDGEESNEIKDDGDIMIVEESSNVRRSTRSIVKKSYLDMLEIGNCTSSDDEKSNKKKKVNVKVAPVFINAAPKPKVDPAILEARKNFLYSGVPSSLKKLMEKQQSLKEIEGDYFPTISHVLQKPEEVKSQETINFWNLPKVELPLKSFDVALPTVDAKRIMDLNKTKHPSTLKPVSLERPEKLTSFKHAVEQLKLENPDYPVYKCFKLLRKKCGLSHPQEHLEQSAKEDKKANRKCPSKRPKRNKKKKQNCDSSVEIIEDDVSDVKLNINPTDFIMWTEKYKPQCTEDIIGNHANILELKRWLKSWVECLEESNSQKAKRKRNNSSSSEFDTTDGESRDSTRLPGNALMLKGPHGSGKSTAVYAACQEFGINVLELNASSKRTGKRLLQELQEATQSHQVRKGESSALSSFIQGNKSKEKESAPQPENNSCKMCLLLVEDVDIVFEQDEGFISALSQLMITSKRPIVLTATDTSSPHLQRFVSQYRAVTFNALPGRTLATWLQIVCLLEGLKVDRNAIAETLEWNKGDVRKTLLQLQFWTQSGGSSGKTSTSTKQFESSTQPKKVKKNCAQASFEHCLDKLDAREKGISFEDVLAEDASNDSFLGREETNAPEDVNSPVVHTDCIEIFNSYCNDSVLPFPLDLSNFWWNSPKILGFKDNFDCEPPRHELNVESASHSHSDTLQDIANVYDCLSQTDVAYSKSELWCSRGPTVRNRECVLKDTVELSESMERCRTDWDFYKDWSYNLVNGYCNLYNRRLERNVESISMSLPTLEQRRWISRRHNCEDQLLTGVSLSTCIDRNAIAIDYFPSLRNIARAENARANTTNKRNNRFYNYLKTLGIDLNETALKTACEILK